MAKATVLHDPATLEEPRSAGDRFVDWRPVGAGGSADVYRVFDSELGIPLAIKRFSSRPTRTTAAISSRCAAKS